LMKCGEIRWHGACNLINLCSVELISISGGISNAPEELLLNPLIGSSQPRYDVVATGWICRSDLGEDAHSLVQQCFIVASLMKTTYCTDSVSYIMTPCGVRVLREKEFSNWWLKLAERQDCSALHSTTAGGEQRPG